MADAMRVDGAGQRLSDVLLPHQLAKGLRPIAPGDDDIFTGKGARGGRVVRRDEIGHELKGGRGEGGEWKEDERLRLRLLTFRLA
jgi:hypothetical protein